MSMKERKHRKRRKASIGGNIAVGIVLTLMGSFMVLPLIYTVSNAFKPLSELFMFPPRFFVRNPTFQNFIDLSTLLANSWVPFSRYLFNTVFITVVGMVGHIFLSSMAAYALSKNRFAGANLIFNIIVLSLMFSAAVTSVPSYMIMTRLKWIDSLLSVIVPTWCSSLGLYLMKQFMEGVPESLIEAAAIDGAGHIQILVRIVMPIVKPAWLTLMILVVQNLWNSNSSYIYSEQKRTLAAALGQVAAGGIGRAGTASVVAVLMMIVPITVFIITQSNVIETMSTSGMKE